MDKYDAAIEFFLTQPVGEVKRAWERPHEHPHGCLFQYITPTGYSQQREDGKPCGCPTQIQIANQNNYRYYKEVAWTDELTKKVVEIQGLLKYLPCALFVTREDLMPFADIQRETDRLIRNQPQE